MLHCTGIDAMPCPWAPFPGLAALAACKTLGMPSKQAGAAGAAALDMQRLCITEHAAASVLAPSYHSPTNTYETVTTSAALQS